MTLSVADIASEPLFKAQMLAGKAGMSHPIAWAHVCELERPWEWLDPGILLLTNGLALPIPASSQVEFVQALHDGGIVGMVISQYDSSPIPTSPMLARADELAFPVLLCDGKVSLSEIIRAVAAANQSQDYARLVKTLRVYDGIRFAIARGDDLDQICRQIARELDCSLGVVEPDGSVVAGDARVVGEIGAELRDALQSAGDRPGLLRFARGEREYLALDLGTVSAVYLVAAAVGQVPVLSLMRHAATVIALEVERRYAERERERRRAGDLWKGFLDGRIDVHQAGAALSEYGLDPESGLQVFAVPSMGDALPRLSAELTRRAVPFLAADRPPVISVLVAHCADSAAAAGLVGSGFGIGVSEPHSGLSGVLDAVRQARWALTGAQGRAGCHHYRSRANPILPQSVEEAQSLVKEVLGEVIGYDTAHGSDLIRSLTAFMAHNRSWQAAADSLFVHKQTLVYRMRRVEELSGRKLGSSSGLAELWLALQALQGIEKW